MKLIILTLLASLLITFNWKWDSDPDRTNLVTGDAGFVAEFGRVPDANTDEQLRIKSHLKHVEDLLRQKDVSGLAPEQRMNRSDLLDMLHTYWQAGAFPRNYDHPGERKPCFIDKDGNICAVGYLVEKSVGRDIAEAINSEFQYAYITDMRSAILSEWIANSGLTLEECAMIQPTYGPIQPPPPYIEPGYAMASAVLSGANVSFMAINGIQLLTQQESKVIPAIGLITGTGQLVYGLAKYPSNNYYIWNDPADNMVTRNVSMLNIGLGTGTVIISAVNLLTRKGDQRTAWNVFSYAAGDDQQGMGLSLVRRF